MIIFFVQHQLKVVGRCGAFSFVFNKGTELAVTTLLVESRDDVTVSNLAHNIPNQDEETTSREGIYISLSTHMKQKTGCFQCDGIASLGYDTSVMFYRRML